MWPERTYWNTVGHHFKFSKEEVKRLLGTIFLIAFIISFDKWGPGNTFDIVYGLRNFFAAVIVSAFSILVAVSAQRLFAISRGYKPEYVMWTPSFGEKGGIWIGAIIGILLVVVSNGRLWWLAMGATTIHFLQGHRIGWFRYSMNNYDWSFVALVGPMMHITLALLFKSLTGFPSLASNELLSAAIALNVWMAIVNMLPIPNLDGSRIFFGTRYVWIFSITLIIVTALQVYFLGAITALITGIVLMAIIAAFLTAFIAMPSPTEVSTFFAAPGTLAGIAGSAVAVLVLLSLLFKHVGAFLTLFIGLIVGSVAVIGWLLFVEKITS